MGVCFLRSGACPSQQTSKELLSISSVPGTRDRPGNKAAAQEAKQETQIEGRATREENQVCGRRPPVPSETVTLRDRLGWWQRHHVWAWRGQEGNGRQGGVTGSLHPSLPAFAPYPRPRPRAEPGLSEGSRREKPRPDPLTETHDHLSRGSPPSIQSALRSDAALQPRGARGAGCGCRTPRRLRAPSFLLSVALTQASPAQDPWAAPTALRNNLRVLPCGPGQASGGTLPGQEPRTTQRRPDGHRGGRPRGRPLPAATRPARASRGTCCSWPGRSGTLLRAHRQEGNPPGLFHPQAPAKGPPSPSPVHLLHVPLRSVPQPASHDLTVSPVTWAFSFPPPPTSRT